MDYARYSRLASRPQEVRTRAAILLRRLGENDEQHRTFLEDMLRYGENEADELTTRQREYLHAIEESTSARAVADGIRADRLIAQAYQLRFNLDDDFGGDRDDEMTDQRWIEHLHAQGAGIALRSGEWRRLLALSRRLDVPLPAWVDLHR